jgi:hypothetical protein
MILQLLAYLGSGLMLGVIAFILAPALAGASKHGHRLGYYYALLAFATVRRPVIRVGEHLDLSFSKAVRDDDWNAETPNGSDNTAYEDPGVWHRLKSYPLAFADDAHGLLFDIKSAAVGQRIEEARNRGDMEIVNGEQRFVRAFLEFPTRRRELVNLAYIRTAVTGGADSSLADRVDDYYEKSQAKRGSAVSSLKMLFPLVGLAAGFGLMWIASTQVSRDAGGGSTISVGLIGLGLSLASLREVLTTVQEAAEDIAAYIDEHPRVYYGLLAACGLLVVLAVAVVLHGAIGTLPFALLGIGFTVGLLIVPGVAWALGPVLGGLGIMLATGMLSLAFWAFDRPVFDQVDESRYELVEADGLGVDVAENTTWFRLCWSWVGFTFDPEACLEDASMEPKTIEALSDPLAADGGDDAGVPAGYAASNELPRANGQWQGYVPANPDQSGTLYAMYVRAAGVMRDVATGRISDRAYRVAKKKYGAGGVSDNDTLILLATVALAVLGAGFGYLVFFA